MSLGYLLERTQDRLLDYARTVLADALPRHDKKHDAVAIKKCLVEAINCGKTKAQHQETWLPAEDEPTTTQAAPEPRLLPSPYGLTEVLAREAGRPAGLFEQLVAILAPTTQVRHVKALLCLRMHEACQHVKETLHPPLPGDEQKDFDASVTQLLAIWDFEKRLARCVKAIYDEHNITCNPGRWGGVLDETEWTLKTYADLCQRHERSFLEDNSLSSVVTDARGADSGSEASFASQKAGAQTSSHRDDNAQKKKEQVMLWSRGAPTGRATSLAHEGVMYLGACQVTENDPSPNTPFLCCLQRNMLHYVVDNVMRQARADFNHHVFQPLEQVVQQASHVVWRLLGQWRIVHNPEQLPCQSVVTCRSVAFALVFEGQALAQQTQEKDFWSLLFAGMARQHEVAQPAQGTEEHNHFKAVFQECVSCAETQQKEQTPRHEAWATLRR